MLETQVGIDAATTARLLGLLVPLLIALIAKKTASQGLKGVLNVLGSAIIGSTVYLVAEDGASYNWTGFVNGTLDTLIPSIAAYYALWKPTGIAGSVANATADFGLGSPPSMQTDDVGAEEGHGLSDQNSTTVASSPRAQAKMRKNDGGALDLRSLAGLLIVLGVVVVLVSYVLAEVARFRGLGWVSLVIGIILLIVLAVTGRSRL